MIVPGGFSIASLILGGEEADESTLRFETPRFIGGGHGVSISRDAEIRPAGHLALVHGRIHVEGTFVNRGTIDVIGGDPHSAPSGALRAAETVNAPEGSILVGEHHYLNLTGTFENRGTITLAPSGSLRFDGSWSGGGTFGAGTITIEGALMPGDGIGAQAFGGDLHLESRSRVAPTRLVIDIAGPRAVQEHDVLLVGGEFTIDAALDVQLHAEMYHPSAGDAFTIVEASEGIDGSFSELLVPSPDWGIQYEDTSIRLLVLDPAGRGDYNGDDRIDQADLDLVLTSWGKGVTHYWPLPPNWTHYLPVGTVDQNHLDAVLSGWGHLIESGAAAPAQIAGQAVPEPSTTSLLILSVALAVCSVRRRSRSSLSPR